MTKSKTVVGVDFGSDSARAVLVDAGTGEILASSSHPLDHQEALRAVLHGVLDGFARRETVAGVSVDATASTPCLTDASGVPLALRPEFADDPDAMFVLWKDHTAEEEARLIVAAANADSARYCRHSADTYSPENCWGKVWHILRTNPAVAEKAAGVVESCDWLTTLLAGGPILRSRCAAAYKQIRHGAVSLRRRSSRRWAVRALPQSATRWPAAVSRPRLLAPARFRRRGRKNSGLARTWRSAWETSTRIPAQSAPDAMPVRPPLSSAHRRA